MKVRSTIMAAVLALMSIAMLAPAAHAAPQNGGLTTQLTGTVNGAAANLTYTIDHFVVQNGALQAVGSLTSTANGVTTVIGGVTAPVSNNAPSAAATSNAPTANQGTSCGILSLTIGPIHLDLLGLVVDVPNPIVVNITAQPGSGNLLGNLLCDVAGLLNNTTGGLTSQVANLLNQLLSIL
jgi:hypothetical protein